MVADPGLSARPWAVAVFAHNEGPRIAAALQSIVDAANGHPLQITVLANGCRDDTAAVAQAFAAHRPAGEVQVLLIALGDKANAWNAFVHDVAAKRPPDAVAMHVFVDGDVRVEPGALPALAAALAQQPEAHAVGALPTTGRDREAWRERMLRSATLAGGLYALRDSFVQRLVQRDIRVPVGLIGEDWFVSVLARFDLQPVNPIAGMVPRVVFAPDAGFAFRSLSPWRWGDHRVHWRRLWRYALRGVQFEIVLGLLLHQHPDHLPRDVSGLYRDGPMPSRLKWVGRTSVLRSLAVARVRQLRSRAG